MRVPDKLYAKGLLSEAQHRLLKEKISSQSFSLFWELRIVLYLAVTLLSSGFSILIYKNIDTIGHISIIVLIAALMSGCFYYAYTKRQAYQNTEVVHPSPFYDYITLLACLLFATLESYLQFQYNVFGERYGLATLLPAILFAFVAYYTDHRGVLSLAITSAAAWVGISAAPRNIFTTNNYDDAGIAISAAGFSIVFIALSWYLNKREIKQHFTFTYYAFLSNILYISLVTLIIAEHGLLPIFGLCILALATWFFIRYALASKSMFFMLVAVFYSYIAVSYLILSGVGDFAFGALYFLLSTVGLIALFVNLKKVVK